MSTQSYLLRIDALDGDPEEAVRLFLAELPRQYLAAAAILFGSRARRTHRPDSDADLALILRGAREPFWKTKLALPTWLTTCCCRPVS
jgi:predicted nucleotidyltransferase